MNRTSTLHRLRTAGIGLCLGGVAVSAWSSAISVRAANTGDIFIQNAGAGAPSGHDNDPKLSCADIDLWGSGLVLSTSTFGIAGLAPTGSGETVYSASWTYSSAVADPQIIAVVPVATLIADAAAAGPTEVRSAGALRLGRLRTAVLDPLAELELQDGDQPSLLRDQLIGLPDHLVHRVRPPWSTGRRRSGIQHRDAWL